MKKLHLLVDVDGILADTLPYWLDKIFIKTGILAKEEDIKKWKLESNEPLKSKVSPNVIYDMLSQPGFFAGVPEMSYASVYLNLLQEEGHKINIVSARSGAVGAYETFAWLNTHFPFIKENQIIICHDKHLIQGDVLIDDRPDNLEKYEETFPHAKLLTIAYPYNIDFINKGFGALSTDAFWVPKSSSSWRLIYEAIQRQAL